MRCPQHSQPLPPEFRGRRSKQRTEQNLQKAEEWGLKALEVESDSSNALVPYFLAIDYERLPYVAFFIPGFKIVL